MNKIYNISNNSKRITATLMLFLQMRFVGLVSNAFNKQAVQDYQEIVENFAEFLHNEEIDDPQQIYEYYNYAMWNGYFSRNHTLQYTLDRKSYLDNAGMSIMSGNAVCLNYADMLSLIFKEMGLNSYMVTCYVDTNNVKQEIIRTDKKIERNIDSTGNNMMDNFFIQKITKLFGNHAIACVESNGELYFFDPTNLIYLNKTGINDVSIINGEGKFDLKYLTSLLLDNVNIFKVVPYTNEFGYNEEVIEKQHINVNIEELEKFYNNQKENIENVAKNNDENNGILSMYIYIIIVFIIMRIIFKLVSQLAKNIKADDIKYLFPKLKEYFNEKNIKTEFEVLKNYEILEKELGIKDNFLKDLLKKSIIVLESIFNNEKIYQLMLANCLNNLGYSATICYAKKYTNKLIKKDIPLIIYYDKNNTYIYDCEMEELLYKDNNNVLKSLDGKYQYSLSDDGFNVENFQNMTKQDIQTKMNNENYQLTKEDIKSIKRSKTLRH